MKNITDMRNLILNLLVILFIVSSCSRKEMESVVPVNTCPQLLRLFADPPSEYRSAPLWDWNEQITQEAGLPFYSQELG